MRAAIAAAVAVGAALHGWKKGSLSSSGAAAAVVVGFSTMAAGWRFGITLLAFYQLSSWLTKVGTAIKREREAGREDGGARDAAQVLANILPGVVLAVVHFLYWGEEEAIVGAGAQRAALAAYLANMATCCGDTWASEVGILSNETPRLVLSGRAVPPGTNGAVTVLGTCASAAGGFVMGLFFVGISVVFAALGVQEEQGASVTTVDVLADHGMWIAFASLWAVLGSFIDSLLGATVQARTSSPTSK